MNLDVKKTRMIYGLMSKMTSVFPSFYIIKPNYILSINAEKPFLAEIEDCHVEILNEIFGDFDMVYIKDIKIFKKVIAGPKPKDDPDTWPKLEDISHIVENKREATAAKEMLAARIDSIHLHENWNSFLLSEDPNKNEELLHSLLTDNNYVNFHPGDSSPMLILTKSLIPLVTEKNYHDLYYSSRKIIDGLYQIIFDFKFNLFRLYMFHTYIPVERK